MKTLKERAEDVLKGLREDIPENRELYLSEAVGLLQELVDAPPAPSVPDGWRQFLTDVITAAGLLKYGKRDKGLAGRIGKFAFDAMRAATTPAEPPEAVVRDAVAAEREACAKVCEKISDEYDENEGLKYAELRTDAATGCGDCAAAIRARGEKGQS